MRITDGYDFTLKYGVQGVLHFIKPDRSRAKTRLSGSRYLYKAGHMEEGSDYVMELECHYIYVCPFSRNCIRAGYVMNKRNPEHFMFCSNILSLNESSNWKGMDHTGGFYFICDQKMEFVSYIYSPEEGARYSTRNDENWQEYMLYESKSELIRQVFGTIQKYGSVSGLQFCDLSVIPDEAVENLGAIRVRDELGRGPDLWLGSIEKIVNPEGLTGTWNRDVKDKLHAQAGVLVDSFRGYLEAA